MKISRRDFLRYSIASAAALGLPLDVVGTLRKAYAAGGASLPKVIWLNAANCTGCTVSLANLINDSGSGPADVADLLINTIDLAFHPTLMGAAGDTAVQSLQQTANGNFILAVEGGIPTAFDGHTCLLWTEGGRDITALEAVRTLAPKAQAVLSIGTCASFGGIPGGGSNPTGILTVGEATGVPAIHIPGCPTHPDWIVSVIAQLLAGTAPALDSDGRPAAIFRPGEEGEIHEHCPREEGGETSRFGVDGRCLKPLGCKGPRTHADCYSRKWNNGSQWCIGANAVCIGCVERGFPDAFLPFYKNNFTSSSTSPGDPSTEPPQPTEPPTQPPTAGALSITKAEWDARRSTLQVEGKGEPGKTVKVYDAGTGSLLAMTNVDSRSRWKLRMRQPARVPARVRATCDGLVVERQVSGLSSSDD